jgi:hypothetical protein
MHTDLSFFTEPPALEKKAVLEIVPLAPLSMVSAQPGSYFRSEITPTVDMVYGLLENALGWHFEDKTRKTIYKALLKTAKKKHGNNDLFKGSEWLKGKSVNSGSGFFSFLQYHLSLELESADENPMTYDDLWSTHFRTEKIQFVGGSRNYDPSLEDVISISRKKIKGKDGKKSASAIQFGDRGEFKTISIEELKRVKAGKYKLKTLKPLFPHYYVSPKSRGYVVPKVKYTFTAKCSKELGVILAEAILNPCAPLYIGSNDGWVDTKWVNHE